MRFVVIFAGLLATSSAVKSYEGYHILEAQPQNEQHVKALRQLYDSEAIDVSSFKSAKSKGSTESILVAPQHKVLAEKYLSAVGLETRMAVDNVQRLIDREQSTIEKRQAQPNELAFAFDQYHSYDEIVSYIQSVAATYPSFASLTTIGTTFEKRTMYLLKLGAPGTNKNSFWIDAGIHAREWIAPATAVWIIGNITASYGSNQVITDLINSVDLYILPVFNPDGYEYSRSNDRMWRKTRSGPYTALFTQCWGVDGNRNWDFEWAVSGASPNPCSDTYEGPKAFSEPECLAGSIQITNLFQTANLKAMITLHSYAEDMLYPYGYAFNTYPPDVQDLIDLGNQAAAAVLQVHGTNYTVVNSAGGLYLASGASDDWSKNLGVKWVYTIELRPGPGDTDNDEAYGFLLPPEYIVRTSDEIWAGLVVMLQRVKTGPN